MMVESPHTIVPDIIIGFLYKVVKAFADWLIFSQWRLQ